MLDEFSFFIGMMVFPVIICVIAIIKVIHDYINGR